MLLVICRMALYTEVTFNITGSRKLIISNLRIDLRFRHQAVWKEAHGQALLLFKKVCGLSQLVCFA